MKSCCGSTSNDSSCKRKDGKTFSLPRKFSKSKCKKPKGFTMKSSCAPYKYCNKGGKRSSNRSKNRSKKNTKKHVLLPKLRPINNKNVKHKYKLSDPQSKRILAIDEGIRDEAKKTGKTLKKAAISKKGRFNILRIYRKNKRPQECKKITSDMKYIDKKYGLGKTTNICKGNKISGNLSGGVAMSGLHPQRLQQQKQKIRKRRSAIPNMEEGSRNYDSDSDFEDVEEYDYGNIEDNDEFHDALEIQRRDEELDLLSDSDSDNDEFYDASVNLDIPDIRKIVQKKPVKVYLKFDENLCENLPSKCKVLNMKYYDLTLVLEFNGANFKVVDLLDTENKNFYDNSGWVLKRSLNMQNVNSKEDLNNILNEFFFKSDVGNILSNIHENHPVEIIKNIFMFKIGHHNKVIILDFNDIMENYISTNVLSDILYPIITVTKCSLEDSKLSNKCIDKSICDKCVTNYVQEGSGKKNFLYNPDNPKKSFDVYIDKNPKDTIPIKYKTLNDVKSTIKKLESLYKNGKYPHKRIWQVGMIMKVRLESLKSKKPQQYKLANKYFKHLGKRSKIKNESDRKKFVFKITSIKKGGTIENKRSNSEENIEKTTKKQRLFDPTAESRNQWPSFKGPGEILEITDLISCIAVIVKKYEDGKLVGVVGGHFITSEAFSTVYNMLTDEGKYFMEDIFKLLEEHDMTPDNTTTMLVIRPTGTRIAHPETKQALKILKTMFENKSYKVDIKTTPEDKNESKFISVYSNKVIVKVPK